MNKITLDDNIYEIIKDYKNGYNKEELEKKYTDYFKDYDYIVGDWAYGKLRLKGFYDSSNKKVIEHLKKLNECNPDKRIDVEFLLNKEISENNIDIQYISELNNEIDNLNNKISKLTQIIDDKNNEILDLKEELSNFNKS